MDHTKKVRDSARKAAAGAASVALATSGLSSCNDNGAVDPLPPPLECNTVNAGQTLIPAATLSESIVTVTIENQTPFGLWSDSLTVRNPVGVRVVTVSEPPALSRDTLVLTLELESPSTTSASFTLVGELQGLDGSRCAFSRTYNLTIAAGGVTIALASGDKLPLHARQRAEIVLARRDGRTVYLEAHTPFRGETVAKWMAAEGQLVTDGHTATWRLPEQPGVYQVELILDYGDAGFAFDALTLEFG